MKGAVAVDVGPHWQVRPAGVRTPALRAGSTPIDLAPGPGFGTGEHPTTHLCLQALGFLLARRQGPARVLDFGAGSGVLAIAAALAGSRVYAVEIDPAALAHARVNAGINGVASRIELGSTLPEEARSFDLVLANVLLSVLLDHADALAARVGPGGHLVLSGLTAVDVPPILARYGDLLAPTKAEVYAREEWRAVLLTRQT